MSEELDMEAQQVTEEKELEFIAELQRHDLPTRFSYRRAFEAGAHWAIKRERIKFKSKLDEQWAIIKDCRKNHAGLGIVEACFRQLKDMCNND